MPKFSQHELGKLLSEKDSERVDLRCGRHNYLASKVPPETRGCHDCWMAYYVWDIATTPPHLRQERLDELESIIHHCVEYEQKGQFKDELYLPSDARFQVEVDKDAE
jgi:hypothetical protein